MCLPMVDVYAGEVGDGDSEVRGWAGGWEPCKGRCGSGGECAGATGSGSIFRSFSHGRTIQKDFGLGGDWTRQVAAVSRPEQGCRPMAHGRGCTSNRGIMKGACTTVKGGWDVWKGGGQVRRRLPLKFGCAAIEKGGSEACVRRGTPPRLTGRAKLIRRGPPPACVACAAAAAVVEHMRNLPRVQPSSSLPPSHRRSILSELAAARPPWRAVLRQLFYSCLTSGLIAGAAVLIATLHATQIDPITND